MNGLCKSMLLLELDSTEYLRFLEIQSTIIDRKIAESFHDVLILLEHPPTVTSGTRGRSSSLTISEEELAKLGVQVHSRIEEARQLITVQANWSGIL